MTIDFKLRSPAGEAIGLEHGPPRRNGGSISLPFGPVIADQSGRRIDRSAMLVLIDQAMGWSIRTLSDSDIPILTVDLRVDWIAVPVPRQALTCDAYIVGRRGRILVLRADVLGEDGALMATGIGQFLTGDPVDTAGGDDVDAARFFEPCDVGSFSAFLDLEERPGHYAMRPRNRFMGAVQMANYHGGVLAAALHKSAELWSDRVQPGRMTISNISVQYQRSTQVAQMLEVEISAVRQGRTVTILSGAARHPQDPKPVASATMILVASAQGVEPPR